jgi:DNA-directed RNA polymerase subunit RPC12/RpoP
MHIALKVVIAFFALCMLILGGIFFIAGGTENAITGGVLVAIAFGMFAFIYLVERIEAKRPITQEVSVTMGGSGEFRDREIKCPSCGAPVEGKDITLVSGGLMIQCPYCGSTSALEEEPKW